MNYEFPKAIRASDLLEIWTDTEDDSDEGIVSCSFEFDTLNENSGLEFLEELARRFNSHDALVAALANLVDATRDTLRSHHDELKCCSVTRKRCDEADAALAAAKVTP